MANTNGDMADESIIAPRVSRKVKHISDSEEDDEVEDDDSDEESEEGESDEEFEDSRAYDNSDGEDEDEDEDESIVIHQPKARKPKQILSDSEEEKEVNESVPDLSVVEESNADDDNEEFYDANSRTVSPSPDNHHEKEEDQDSVIIVESGDEQSPQLSRKVLPPSQAAIEPKVPVSGLFKPQTSSLPKPTLPKEPLSPQQQLKLQEELSAAKLEQSKLQNLLNQFADGKLLPDKGVKLKAKMRGFEDKISQLMDELKLSAPPPSGSVIINEEEKLDLLHKKSRMLKQQFQMLGKQADQSGLRGKIQAVDKEILALEPIVKMRNPRYEAPKLNPQTPLAERNNRKIVNVLPPQLQQSSWQEARQGIYNSWTNSFADENMLAQGPAANRLYGGRMNDARRDKVVTVTSEAMAGLKKALDTMPAETDEEEQPKGLKNKYQLYPHQKQALAWLIWRETQNPRGGILADDMGLGKTLTLLSLILKAKEEREGQDEDKKEKASEEWMNKKGKNNVLSKGTLVICPASLIGHWEAEVKSKVKNDQLSVLVYHGPNRYLFYFQIWHRLKSKSKIDTFYRQMAPKRLARYDVVVTTYGTVQSEVSKVLPEPEGKKSNRLDDLKPLDLDNIDTKDAILLNIIWDRIILDEAHQIRNPVAKTSKAICRVRAAKRWAVTGTPIQNEEKDMFALIRFLRCAPFDEYGVWKQWVDKSPMGQARMNTLVKSLLLRRTKDQKSNITGDKIVPLPPKETVMHEIKLKDEERKVYDEVFSFSKQAMTSYMKKHEQKKEDQEYIKSITSSEYKYKHEEFKQGEAEVEMGKKFNDGSEIKAHHLLVLLLRLRQICNHPGLIKSMLDDEAKANEGLEQTSDADTDDLLNQMSRMSIGHFKENKKENEDPEEDLKKKILDADNPVFREKRASSKIETVIEALEELRKKRNETGVTEKAVIVSQWTSMLLIIKNHVKSLGFKVSEINGQVPVKLRGGIVEDFNRKNGGAEVMLLSLGAGGVGLNLVGANHLFLLDMHWNPQLEAQACDRIYRVGQVRDVTIHKFLTEDTVESRILELQNKKLELANSVLTGAKRTGGNKLTMEDLKMLFDLNRK